MKQEISINEERDFLAKKDNIPSNHKSTISKFGQ